MIRAMLILFSTVLAVHAEAGVPKTIRIDFVETLGVRDTTSSIRFQKDYEGAIELGKTLLGAKLTNCGYTLETKTAFYDASDALRAKELAAQSETEGAWLIVGPRRSNHYLLLVQGTKETPTVSLMASADEVGRLGVRHVSVSPSNSQMARIAAQEAKREKGPRASYVTVVNDDCTNCVDFAKAFDAAATSLGLKKIDEIKIMGETFDVEPIRKAIISKNPKFVLLPNYSKVSSQIMGAFNRTKKAPLFIGGDGWGDNRYGFVEHGQQVENIRGLTVRGFPPIDQQLKQFPLGEAALKKESQIPFSAANAAILKIFDSVSDLVCSKRPADKAGFVKAFEKSSGKIVRAPWGVSIYELKSGGIAFRETRKAVR